MPPVGRGRGSGEKPKDFKGTMLRLLGYVGRHKFAVLLALLFAVGSVVFNIVGPRVLGTVTTKLFEGLVATVQGTGSVDFAWIGTTLLGLLGIYLASSACNLVQGWLMTGVTQKVCHRMRTEIAEKIDAWSPWATSTSAARGTSSAASPTTWIRSASRCNQSITQLITSVTQVVGVLVMMLSISLPLTGVTVLTLPACRAHRGRGRALLAALLPRAAAGPGRR